MDEKKLAELTAKADRIRKLTIECIGRYGQGHIGGSVSITEALACLYFEQATLDPENPQWEDRDRIVLSKGHAGPGLYSTLALKGYFDESVLHTLNKNGTSLPSHCDMLKVPGVDFTAGSLGQGLSAAVGMAIAARIDKKKYRVYCIIGDGESQEGQIWEAIALAAQKKLGNLTILVDNNGMQIDGTTDEVCKMNPYDKKFKAYGYKTIEVDGHDIAALSDALNEAAKGKTRPTAIIMNTVKGKGVKCCEGKVASHSVAFTEELWRSEINGN